MPKVKSVSINELDNDREKVGVLLVTATNVETLAVHKYMRPLPTRNEILKLHAGNQTYYVAKYGRYAVAQLQCEMGAISPNASLGAVTEAIHFWSPRAIVMVGIAFGVDARKQRIGDVLVAKNLVPYDIKRVGENATVHRSAHPAVSTKLYNRFKNQKEWRFPISASHSSKIIPCALLSGESLVDNPKFRDLLLTEFPTAEGGEMEGVGVYSAAHAAGVQWIVVKAICDFADGKKSVNKTKRQQLAASASASLCAHVFSTPNSLEDLGCVSLTPTNDIPPGKTVELQPEFINAVLFDVFQARYQEYYYVRAFDEELSAVLKLSSVWIVGISGTGKTTALLRNLEALKCKYYFVDLSSAVNATVQEFFDAILTNLQEKVGTLNISPTKKKRSLNETILQISQLLITTSKDNTVVVIDEIPLSEATIQDFADAAIALIITVANADVATRIKFAFSTLLNPFIKLQGFQIKVRQKARQINIASWQIDEIEGLLNLTCSKLSLRFTAVERQQVISAANGSPRHLKEILRTYLMFYSNTQWDLSRAIAEATSNLP